MDDTFEVGMIAINAQTENTYTIRQSQITKSYTHSERNNIKYNNESFAGACLDTGAQQSVCGINQASAGSATDLKSTEDTNSDESGDPNPIDDNDEFIEDWRNDIDDADRAEMIRDHNEYLRHAHGYDS